MLLFVLVVNYFPIRIAFEKENGVVCVGVIGRVYIPEGMVSWLYSRKHFSDLLRVKIKYSISIDVKCKHLQSK